MKFGIVVFPGSNCDMDMFYVLKNIMKQNVVKLWHKETDLKGVDFNIVMTRERSMKMQTQMAR